MKRCLSIFAATLALAAGGCSSAGSGGGRPTPEEGAAAPELTTLLVLSDAGRLERGDTVRVDLSRRSDDNQVPYYRGSRRAGTVAYDALGPAGAGTMMVMASTLNVRRCRSTGCSVVGQVNRGQHVRVWDLKGRWYRYAGRGLEGYLNVEHLVLPDAYHGRLLAEIRAATSSYYRRELDRLRAGGGRVFSGYAVKLVGDRLTFEFYTPRPDGPSTAAACRAMDGISSFVQRTMAPMPGDLFPAFSAGVYYDDPDTPSTQDTMVAGMAGAGGAFCAND
ncbi:MAG: hypothetical protein GWN99_19695 [Gemmatimonadetes bacterium]|uniref:SH3 domain-containing protein n=1 Tax=Candidatus Kutchimonas denitrificans TaxID=3056748 RepID=A0AAE5CCT8_9BACT|nr:hypothetical protein [Gemmatimonadota bacterium]NIR76428.1 hypothetical protein [Candidatus Kutchimonas denitrificans]NIS03247.1 hypothetical protein [Gemmatimonadota bacterium]NIT69108.1 hypothetical protein [Gemmatimonadota bacterium]NIU54500.1 hypothetical protein [Gemmatimonadota bacterium]